MELPYHYVTIILFSVILSPGPLVGRAALYTAGVVGGLSLTAACAPSDKYLKWGGPLALGLGVVFVSSIGTLYTSHTPLKHKYINTHTCTYIQVE